VWRLASMVRGTDRSWQWSVAPGALAAVRITTADRGA
jgi:hypothetical protein